MTRIELKNDIALRFGGDVARSGRKESRSDGVEVSYRQPGKQRS